MTSGPRPHSEQFTSSWDTYWQGTGDVGAWTAGGVSHPAIQGFWATCFNKAREAMVEPSILDIATGNGALVEIALQVFRPQPIHIHCVDASQSAIDNIQQRFPEVEGLVCDAASIPLESRGFDLVCSQFGIEYAGMDAVNEAARLVAPGGQLVLLMHHSEGLIYSECKLALEAISVVRDAQFVPLALQMFRAGFEAVRGADRAPYDESAARLQPAADALEKLLSRYGEDVAGGTVARLYGDVSRIHGKLPNYDPDEVLGWLQRMDGELGAFADRMTSMINSALDESGFVTVRRRLLENDLDIEESGPLLAPGQPSPLGWALIAAAP